MDEMLTADPGLDGARLLTPAEVGAYFRVRDRRTVRRRLAELGIPVVPMGRGYRVRVVDLERAVAAAAQVERAGNGHSSRPAGVVLRPGERLWDRAGTMAPLSAARRGVGQPGEQRLGQRPPGQRRGG
jgi:hypothetical protein